MRLLSFAMSEGLTSIDALKLGIPFGLGLVTIWVREWIVRSLECHRKRSALRVCLETGAGVLAENAELLRALGRSARNGVPFIVPVVPGTLTAELARSLADLDSRYATQYYRLADAARVSAHAAERASADLTDYVGDPSDPKARLRVEVRLLSVVREDIRMFESALGLLNEIARSREHAIAAELKRAQVVLGEWTKDFATHVAAIQPSGTAMLDARPSA
jgi:hypothetical protein